MNKVIITTFTDPMMGLSYECEPVFRRLETHFGEKIAFRYVMSGLVRNVYDFVDRNDLRYGQEYALKQYLKKLAGIYKSEESLGGLPINMEGFALFDREHTSSVPLCLAYKAAELTERSKAALFLYNLRYATVVETKPTTHFEEILRVVQATGIDAERFTAYYNGAAQAALQKDFDEFEGLGVYSLPAYLLQYEDKRMLINRLIGYDAFVQLIDRISGGSIRPQSPTVRLEAFVRKHPLISLKELAAAFDLADPAAAVKKCGNMKIEKEFVRYETNI
ncbi:MAG: DsbA family protein [Eubacterium sp.]|nr:DsbA family protein [Eubacterium sp.]